jgi:hypothetical protein
LQDDFWSSEKPKHNKELELSATPPDLGGRKRGWKWI